MIIALECFDENCRIPFKNNSVYPITATNSRALLAASVSTSNTIAGNGICCESEAKTSPTSLRMTTPIPAWFSLLKSAPSKFILTCSWSGGLQHEARVAVGGDVGL